jgi:phosphoglycerate dehydrogenase-like enzyme
MTELVADVERSLLTVCLPDPEAAAQFAEPPPGIRLVAWDGLGTAPDEARSARLFVPSKKLGGRDRIARAVAQLPELEVVQLQSAGADGWIGLTGDAVLCDASGVHGSPTSEWAVGATLALLKSFPLFAVNQASGRWHRPGTVDELAGKRVLIIGAGDIGGEIRRRLVAFDAEVRLVARTARDGVSGTEELPELLGDSDIVILCVPLTAATRGMVGRRFLEALPLGALLVNASRGPVVDTDELVAVLSERTLLVALDVTDPEPLPAGHPLWSSPGVFITPHVGGFTHGFPERMHALVADQIERLRTGRPPRNVVRNGY